LQVSAAFAVEGKRTSNELRRARMGLATMQVYRLKSMCCMSGHLIIILAVSRETKSDTSRAGTLRALHVP